VSVKMRCFLSWAFWCPSGLFEILFADVSLLQTLLEPFPLGPLSQCPSKRVWELDEGFKNLLHSLFFSLRFRYLLFFSFPFPRRHEAFTVVNRLCVQIRPEVPLGNAISAICHGDSLPCGFFPLCAIGNSVRSPLSTICLPRFGWFLSPRFKSSTASELSTPLSLPPPRALVDQSSCFCMTGFFLLIPGFFRASS